MLSMVCKAQLTSLKMSRAYAMRLICVYTWLVVLLSKEEWEGEKRGVWVRDGEESKKEMQL
eukprot:14507768-Ditylum_brightwellii.AAC.1